jgi:hypothetical protein
MRRDRIIEIPESGVKAINGGVVVKDTMKLCAVRAGLIYLPDSDRQDFDKQVEIGEVVSKGMDVEGIEVGDVVLYRRLTAFWLPNGLEKPFLWKIESPLSILVVIPGHECHEIIPTEPEAEPKDLAWMQAREGNPIEKGIRHYM